MEIPVLYEDKDYLILNKPAGLVVHSDGKTKESSLADWILEHYPRLKNVGEPIPIADSVIPRPGIVHRLDRDTSGAIVIAKNQVAFTDLKEKFKNREVAKKNNEFVYGVIKEDDGVIDRPIGRSNKDFRMWSAQRGARGELREAVTHYRVVARGSATGGGETDNDKNFTFLEVEPKTGRTHQIRAHFKAINYPIISDPVYAPKREPILGFKRTALHSRSISFTGLDGKLIEATAPYPADFLKALKKIGAIAK